MSTCTMPNNGNGDINHTEINRLNNQQPRLEAKNFKKLRDLGRGAYGICGLYKDERSILNKKVVIKRVSLECKTETEKRKISYEANLLRKLIHPKTSV
ncbi:Protein kinase domain-containing protein [Meloidogyne graminicola]|uniref:Protein kinase domain-containing protein n=1 Tax=Meloidogyne graminicola TaxID=189291 RepID=A0A8S9Z9Z2_9BILA|nr:Protein kinase domain-containing protein [Meloidogyne graminicola]